MSYELICLHSEPDPSAEIMQTITPHCFLSAHYKKISFSINHDINTTRRMTYKSESKKGRTMKVMKTFL